MQKVVVWAVPAKKASPAKPNYSRGRRPRNGNRPDRGEDGAEGKQFREKPQELAGVERARWQPRDVALLKPVFGPGPEDLVQVSAGDGAGTQCRTHSGLHTGTLAKIQDSWDGEHVCAVLAEPLEDGLPDPSPHRRSLKAVDAAVDVTVGAVKLQKERLGHGDPQAGCG